MPRLPVRPTARPAAATKRRRLVAEEEPEEDEEEYEDEEEEEEDEDEERPRRRQMSRRPAKAAPARRRAAALDEDEDEDEDDEEEEEEDDRGRGRRSNLPDPDELLQSGARSASFKKLNSFCIGTIVKKETGQQRDIKTKQLKYWDNGDPMLHIIYTIQTERRDDDNDDGLRRIFVKRPGGMLTAIKKALQDSGADRIEVGGKLKVKFVGYGQKTNKAFDPPKEYEAKYWPPKAARRG